MKFFVASKTDFYSKKVKKYLMDNLDYEYDKLNQDIVFTIGGDVTFLKAIHKFPNALFFGIHTGHLGFYSNFNYKELDRLINMIKKGDFKEEKMPLISATAYTDDGIKTYYALNEITLISSPRTLILDLYINDKEFEEFRGTGICVSTPTGSTAYNKSLGGAILDHSIDAFQITEIAGINSRFYETIKNPIVLGGKNVVTFKPGSLYKSIDLTVDNLAITLEKLNRVEVKYNEKTVRVAIDSEVDFLDRIKRSFFHNTRRNFKK